MMGVGLTIGVLGFSLALLVALGLINKKLKRVFNCLCVMSFIYSALELFRYIIEYIRVTQTAFPSLFHIELVIVAFAPCWLLYLGLKKVLENHV